MPKNNNLAPVKLPMDKKFGREPVTLFMNNLTEIDVRTISAPSLEDLENYIPYFVDATWAENPMEKKFTQEEKEKYVEEMFSGMCLPTARETIKFTFYIDGISLQEVTHILRHRLASFSADCSGDKWWSDKDCLVPESVQNSPEFYERYKSIVEASKQLYCDMVDSKDISIMDARSILTRNLSTFYYMSIDLGNLLAFINQRKDVQIQPQTDNVLAYKLTHELIKLYGGKLISKCVSFANPSPFYQKMARTGKATNLYIPEPEVDTFDWNEKDFIYNKRREELNGTNPTNVTIFKQIQMYYFQIFKDNGIPIPEGYFER